MISKKVNPTCIPNLQKQILMLKKYYKSTNDEVGFCGGFSFSANVFSVVVKL